MLRTSQHCILARVADVNVIGHVITARFNFSYIFLFENTAKSSKSHVFALDTPRNLQLSYLNFYDSSTIFFSFSFLRDIRYDVNY